MLIIAGDNKFAGGVESIYTGNQVSKEVSTTNDRGTIVLNGRDGVRRFGNPGQASPTTQKAIQEAMWRKPIPDRQDWLKQLLLAYDNQFVMMLNLLSVAGA